MRVCTREVLIRPTSLVASASPCSRATAIRRFHTSSTLSHRTSPPSPPSSQPRSGALPPPAPSETKTVLSLQPNVYYPANQLHSVPKASSPNSITLDRAGAIGGGEVYAVQGERSHHRASFAGAKFMTSAGSISSLPKKSALQEVIIAGRSNSGKSSLINALLSSTKLVKTSGKAGHTKTLNFFEIPKQFILVDAPGYGESGRAEWSSLFKYYITRREPSPPSLIIALFQLTKDLAPSDLLFVESLPPTVNLLPIFTKTDICPLHQIVERKRLLDTRIQSLRDIAAREAEDEVEVEAQGQGLKRELPRKGRTWPGMCVAVKPGWVLRDQTVDNVRAVILKQLEVSAALDARIRSNPVTSRHDPLAGIKFRPQRTRHPHKTPSEISAASSPSSSDSSSAVPSPLSHLTRSEALRMGVKNLDALRAQHEAMAQMDKVEAGMGASCRGGPSEWMDSTWVEETVKHGRETSAPGRTRGSSSAKGSASHGGRGGVGGRRGRGAGHKSFGLI